MEDMIERYWDTGFETSERAVTNVVLRLSSTDKGVAVKRGLSKGGQGIDGCVLHF